MKHTENLFLRSRNLVGLLWMTFFVVCSTINLYAQEYSLGTIPNVRSFDSFNHVSNPDDILSVAYVDSINRVLNVLEDSTGVEVAVVAITSVGNNDVRQFATELFNYWGIGKKGKDNGLLVLLVTKPEQRAVVFETGYGIEGILPDATCYRIQQDEMLPEMKKGDYSLGMYKGIKVVSEHLSGGKKLETTNQATDEDDVELTWWEWIFMIVLFLILGAFFILVVYLIPTFLINLGVGVVAKIIIKIWPKVCPVCGKRSFRLDRREVIKRSTFKSTGSRVDYYVCSHCGHKKHYKRTIKKMSLLCYIDEYLPHRRYGGRGGSSGGSWGGGSSGGGGSISNF